MTGEERRDQLLDVTRAIVAEQGFHAVSIEAVARCAGITRPVVYGHFADLGALLEAMLTRENGRALRQLAAILPTDLASGDPREALLTGLRGYLEAVRDEPITWRLVLIPPEGAPAMLREQVERGRAAVVAALADAVRPGMAPRLASPDPELTAYLLSGTSDVAARLLLTDPDAYPIERLVEHIDWVLGRLLA